MSSGFITEAEIQEKRKIRQEQWDKVRKPEEPLQAPEEPVDNRSLYDRLKEQKDRKQEEFEEAHKLKNLVKTLDDEEVQFLDYVDQVRSDEERRKRLEEAKELDDFRSAVSQLREQEIDKVIHQEIGLGAEKSKTKSKLVENVPSIGTLGKSSSQTKLLAGLVKRKSESGASGNGALEAGAAKKAKLEDSESKIPKSSPPSESTGAEIQSVPSKGSLVCIGVLPGLGSYSDSSSDNSSDEDDEPNMKATNPNDKIVTDLAGRTLQIIRTEEKK